MVVGSQTPRVSEHDPDGLHDARPSSPADGRSHGGTTEQPSTVRSNGSGLAAMGETPKLLQVAKTAQRNQAGQSGAPRSSAAQGPASNAPGGGGAAPESGPLSREQRQTQGAKPMINSHS